MEISDTVPTILYKKGQSHEVAALILMVNFTQRIFEQIQISKYDHTHYDGKTEEGFIYKEHDVLNPLQYMTVDSLSSFDLEYTCNYMIELRERGSEATTRLHFTLDKYGRFEGSEKEKVFEELNLSGKIINTTIINC